MSLLVTYEMLVSLPTRPIPGITIQEVRCLPSIPPKCCMKGSAEARTLGRMIDVLVSPDTNTPANVFIHTFDVISARPHGHQTKWPSASDSLIIPNMWHHFLSFASKQGRSRQSDSREASPMDADPNQKESLPPGFLASWERHKLTFALQADDFYDEGQVLCREGTKEKSLGVKGDLLKKIMALSTEGPVSTPYVRTEAGESRESICNQDFWGMLPMAFLGKLQVVGVTEP